MGPHVRLAIDYHHRLNVAEAAAFCQRIRDVDLMFLEEPIRSESPDAYSALRAMTPMPFAIGEEFSGIYPFAPFIERGLANYVRLDVCNVGRLYGCPQGGRHGRGPLPRHRPPTPHREPSAWPRPCTSALPSTTSPFWNTTGRCPTFPRTCFPGSFNCRETVSPLPQGPGLGIEFDEESARRYPPLPWEAPHFRRRDGAFTNY